MNAAEERRNWDRCRYVHGSQGGHYESYFQRANHPQRPLAFWVRHTIFCPRGKPDDACGELWAVFFDGERGRITAAKEVYPLDACRFPGDAPDLRIDGAILTASDMKGSVASRGYSLRWELRHASTQAPLLLLPRPLYDSRLPKAKALTGSPNAIFDGTFTVDGETIPVDRWQGSLNHNWGSKHTDSYAWGQVAGFDNAPDAFLECSTARLKLGPLWTPFMSLIVLRVGEREFALNSIGQSLRAHGRFDFFDWRIESRSPDARIALHIGAPQSAFVGLHYANPPGGGKTCLNSKLASCELTLEVPGQPLRRFTTQHRAAFEILTERNDHGVRVAA